MANRENIYERPAFSQWAEERVTQPPRFDNIRLDRVPVRERRDGQAATSPELAWNARRRHAPCHTRVPATCQVDCHYLRLDEEFEYVIRLSHILSVPGHASLDRASWVLLAFSPPFAPYRWPILSRPTPFPRQEFAPEGEIFVSGDPLPRDSAYALYEASLVARAGDPGRFISEFRREARMRSKGRLVSWTQVEYHQIFPAHRADLYPEIPSDWAEWEVPEKMLVPLPPSLAYAGSRLLRNDRLAWAIFYTEWVVLVFGRWVADAYHRGLLWRLPKRVLTGIQDLGLGELLRLSSFPVKGVDALLGLHDKIDWAGVRPALARVGAVPLENIGGSFSIEEHVGMPVQGNLQRDEDEEVVAEGRWDDPLFLREPPRRGIRLRSTAQPENPRRVIPSPPGKPMPVLPAEKRTPHSARPLSSCLSTMALPPSSHRGELPPASASALAASSVPDNTPVVAVEGIPQGGDMLSATRIEEWMWRLNIHYALGAYFPGTGMNEEDIARAFALLLVERDQARNRVASIDRALREEKLDRRQLSIVQERAADHLRQAQGDLDELRGRLSSKEEGSEKKGGSQGSVGFGSEDGRNRK
jgi:hypothetical protein